MTFAFTENGGEGRGGGGVGGGVQRQHRRVRRDRGGRHDLPPDHDHHPHHWLLRCLVSSTIFQSQHYMFFSHKVVC